jgi:hypothetical protein
MLDEYYIPPLGAKENIGPHRQLPELRGVTVTARCRSAQERREAPASKDQMRRPDQCTDALSPRSMPTGDVARICERGSVHRPLVDAEFARFA